MVHPIRDMQGNHRSGLDFFASNGSVPQSTKKYAYHYNRACKTVIHELLKLIAIGRKRASLCSKRMEGAATVAKIEYSLILLLLLYPI